MAGLQSQNISVASAHLLGEAYLERNTCVFCRRRATPSLSDPHAPLFALFSLVDCRHYVCQPCALVNCDNDGRLIECPQCHCISRLAQTGRKRTSASLPHRSSGNDDGDEKARRGAHQSRRVHSAAGPERMHRHSSRVSIDDGVSSVASRGSRGSTARPRSALRSEGQRRHRPRSNSVQFSTTITPSNVEEGQQSTGEGDEPQARRATSPLTQDAVAALPIDPSELHRQRRQRDAASATSAAHTSETSATAVTGHAASNTVVGLYTLNAVPPIVSAGPRRRSRERARSEPTPQSTRPATAEATLDFPKPPPLQLDNATVKTDVEVTEVPLSAPEQTEEMKQPPVEEKTVEEAEDKKEEEVVVQQQSAVASVERDNVPAAPAHDALDNALMALQLAEFELSLGDATHAEEEERKAVIASEVHIRAALLQKMEDERNALYARRDLESDFNLSPGTPSAVPQSLLLDSSDQVSATSDDDSVLRSLAGRPRAEGTGAKAIHTAEGAALESGSTSRSHDKHGRRHRSTSHSTQRRRRRSSSQQQAEDESAEQATKGDNEEATKGTRSTVSSTTSPIAPASTEEEAAAANVRQAREQEKQQAERLQAQQEALQQHETLVRRAIVESDEAIRGEYERLLLESATALQLRCAALEQQRVMMLQDSQRAQRLALDQIERHARTEYVEQEASERAWVTSSERVARVLAATAEAERLQREREAERLRHTLAQVRAAMEGLVHEEATQRRRLEQREDGARCGLRDEATETVASVRHTAAEAAGRRREALRRQWLLDLEELQRDEDEDRYGLREAEREQRRAMREALVRLRELDQEEAEERQRVVRQEQNQRSVLATEEGVGLMKAQLLSLHRVHRSEEKKEDLKRRQQQLLLQQQQAAANALETAESIALQQKQKEQLQDSQRAQRMALDQIERHARAEYVEQEASERAWVTSSERVARVLAATAEAERLQREREAERLRHTLAQVRAAMEGLVHEEAAQRRRLEQREDGARRGLRDEAVETVASVRHTAAEAAGRRREALRRQWLLDLEELQRDEDEDRYGLREAEREQRRAMREALVRLRELDQEEAEERQRVVRQEQNQRSVLATEEGVGLMKAQLLSLHRVHRSEEKKEDLKRRQQQLLLQQQQAAANALETAESIVLQQKQKEQLQDSQRAQRMALDQIERHARAEYVEQEASERAWVTSSERVARVLAATAEAERLQREREAERLRHTLAQVRAAMEGLVHEEAAQRRHLEQREDGARRGLRDEAAETVASVRHTAAEAAGRRREALRRQWLLDLEELQRDEDEDRYGLREAEREQRRAMRRRALALLSELSTHLVSPAATAPAESVLPDESNASATAVSVTQKKGSAPLPLTASKSQRVDDEGSRALQEVQDARTALQLRLSRERELAREEEILEANARLREAERRLAKEAHHRAKAEAEKAAVMQDAQRLIEEAQQRAEERIHRAQAAAAAELATAVAFMRDAEERRAAHDALLHSLAEEEQRAVLTAKLQAAERALAEAEQRAAQEIDRVRQEAVAQAAEEAARVEREAQVRAAAVAEQQRAALELQLAEHAAERAEAARRLQIVEANAAAAVERAREEARQAALQAERRFAEMRQRRAERESELRAAQAELRRARAEVKEFELSHMSYSNADNGSRTAVSALAEEGNAAQLLASPVAPPFPSDWSSSSDTSSSQPMHDTMPRVKKETATLRQDVATEVKRPRATAAVATSMTDAAATTTVDRAVQASVPRGAVVSTHDVATSPAATTTTTTTTSGSGAPRVTLSESHLLRQAVREAVHELLAAQRGAHHLTERAARRVRRSVTRYEQRQAERDRAEHDLLEAETSLEVDTNDISELSAIAAPLPAQSSSHMLGMAMPSATVHEAPPSEVAHATAESIHSASASSRFFDTPARRAVAPQPQPQQQQQKVRKYRSNGFEVYYRPRDEADRRNKEDNDALLASRGVPKATMTRPVMDYSDVFFHHGSVRAHLAARRGRRRGRSPPATSSYTGEGHPYCSAKETAAAVAATTPPHRSRTRGRARDSVLHEAEEEEAPKTADAAAQTVMTSEIQRTAEENNNNAMSEEEAETQKAAPARTDAAVQTSPSLEVVVEDVKASTLRTPPRATTTTTPDHVTHHTHEEGEEEEDNNMTAAEPKTVRKKFDAFFVPLGETASPRRPKPPTPCHYVPAPGTTRRTATTKRRPSAEDYRASRRLFSRSRTHSAPGKTWATEKGTATRSGNNDELDQRGRQRTTSRPPGNKPSNSRTRAQGLPRNANRRRSSRMMPDERPGNNKAKGDEVDDEVNVYDKPTQDEEAAATARAFTPPPLPHRHSSSKAKGKTAATTAYFDPHHEPSHPPFSSTSQKENAGHHARPRRTSDAAYYMPAHTKTISPSGVSHHNDAVPQEKAKVMYDAAAAPAESLEEEEDYDNMAALQSAWPNVYTYSVAELLAPQRRPRPPHGPPPPPRKAGTRSPFARPYAVAAGVPYGAEELRQTRAHLPRAPMKDMVQTPVISHARRGVATAQTTLDSPPRGHVAHNAMHEDDAVTATQVGDVPYLDHSRYVPSFAELDQRLRQLRANERAHTTSTQVQQQQQHSYHHFDPVITVTLPNKSSALTDLKPVAANVNALPKQQQSLWSTSGGGPACTTSLGAMDMGEAGAEGNIMRWRMRSHSRQGAAQRRVSPPWRTELNSGPLRPPWNCRQPHSPVYRPPATRTVSPQ